MSMVEDDPRKPLGMLASIMSGKGASWWNQAMQTPPEEAQQQVRDVVATPAKAAFKWWQDTPISEMPGQAYDYVNKKAGQTFGASEDMRTTGVYNPEPVVDAAMLPMGTGAVAGVPMKAGETALGAGILRPKLPPLFDTYHGTGSPAEFKKFKLPPPEHDLGIHTTVSPNVAGSYAYDKSAGEEGLIDFMSGKAFDAPDAATRRIKPVLTDARSPLKFPTDAIKWNEPGNVIESLEDAMRAGFTAPRGLLSDFKNIESDWKNQFAPMLKDKGYDSIFYPHYDAGAPNTANYNTFMTFDPKQVIPKYSPGGQHMIKQRGLVEPAKVGNFWPYEGNFDLVGDWHMPPGVLKEPKEIESLVKTPEKNTFKWWDDPEHPLSKSEAKYAEQSAKDQKQLEMWSNVVSGKMKMDDYTIWKNEQAGIPKEASLKFIEQDKWYQKYGEGKISKEKLDEEIAKINAKKTPHYSQHVSDELLGQYGHLPPTEFDKAVLSHKAVNDLDAALKEHEAKVGKLGTYDPAAHAEQEAAELTKPAGLLSKLSKKLKSQKK